MKIIYFFFLFIIHVNCSTTTIYKEIVNPFSGIKYDTLKHPLVPLFNELYSNTLNKDHMIYFDSCSYYMFNSVETEIMFGLEFKKDSLDKFSRNELLTISQMKYEANLDDYLLYYLASTSQYRYSDPKLFSIKRDDTLKVIIVDHVLIDHETSVYEHCLIKFTEHSDRIIKSFAHTIRFNYYDVLKNPDLVKKGVALKRVNWINNLADFKFDIFPQVTSDSSPSTSFKSPK